MKKLLPMCMIAMILAGCVMPVSTRAPEGLIQPTLSDAEMQTQIAMVMTAMPTSTPLPQSAVTNTPEPVVATATQAADQSQGVPENTNTPTSIPIQPTDTPELPTPTFTPPAPTATFSPGDPRARLGNPSASDPMNNADAWIWPTGNNEFTAINFSNGQMTLTGLTDQLGWRLANPEGTAFGNIYLEATFHTGDCSGVDQYGFVVRVPVLQKANQGYIYGFTCDGRFAFRKWDGEAGPKGSMWRLKEWAEHSAINKGADQTNRMGILMSGERMLLYANGQLLGEVSDNTWTNGYFGLYVGAGSSDDFAVQIDEMAYWKNAAP